MNMSFIGQFNLKKISINIRWMIHRDLIEVLEIERSSFDINWTEEDFLNCLRQRNCIGMVAESDGKILAFLIYEVHQKKIQILNFAVDSQHRRLKIGSQIIKTLIDKKLSKNFCNEIFLHVRETNLIAQIFFRENGFRATQTLKNFYDNLQEDVYCMQYKLSII